MGVGYLRGGESTRFTGTLAGADSMGIIAKYEKDGRILTRFLPWGIIEYVQLVDEETRQWREQRRAQQPPGFST